MALISIKNALANIAFAHGPYFCYVNQNKQL